MANGLTRPGAKTIGKGLGGGLLLLVWIPMAALIIWGKGGILDRLQMGREIAKLEAEIRTLQEENSALRHDIQRLQTDPTAYEGPAREMLLRKKMGEVVVYLPPAGSTGSVPRSYPPPPPVPAPGPSNAPAVSPATAPPITGIPAANEPAPSQVSPAEKAASEPKLPPPSAKVLPAGSKPAPAPSSPRGSRPEVKPSHAPALPPPPAAAPPPAETPEAKPPDVPPNLP